MLHSPPSQATGHTCNNYNGSTTEISECSDNSLLMENETETYQLGSAHILLMSFSTLHCILVTLWALVRVVLIVAVLPFPAAPLIWTGYMECVQLSSGSFVWKELRKWKSCWNSLLYYISKSKAVGHPVTMYTIKYTMNTYMDFR